MSNQVTAWKMTEEQRLEYVAKHPIKPSKQAKKRDFKWRGEKGNAARWGNK